jgi:hypothetical protein
MYFYPFPQIEASVLQIMSWSWPFLASFRFLTQQACLFVVVMIIVVVVTVIVIPKWSCCLQPRLKFPSPSPSCHTIHPLYSTQSQPICVTSDVYTSRTCDQNETMAITKFRISRLTFAAFRVSVSKVVGFFVPPSLYFAQPRSFRLPRNEDIRVFRLSPGRGHPVCHLSSLSWSVQSETESLCGFCWW